MESLVAPVTLAPVPTGLSVLGLAAKQHFYGQYWHPSQRGNSDVNKTDDPDSASDTTMITMTTVADEQPGE